MEEKDVFKEIETDEKPSSEAKKNIISEIEIIQNSAQVLELFATNYLNTLGSLFINE